MFRGAYIEFLNRACFEQRIIWKYGSWLRLGDQIERPSLMRSRSYRTAAFLDYSVASTV